MIRAKLDRNIRALTISLVMALLFLYFSYLTIMGDRGVMALWRVKSEVSRAEAELAAIKSDRAALGARVTHMRSGSIDPDLLEEQSRATLNIARPSDVVVLTAPVP